MWVRREEREKGFSAPETGAGGNISRMAGEAWLGRRRRTRSHESRIRNVLEQRWGRCFFVPRAQGCDGFAGQPHPPGVGLTGSGYPLGVGAAPCLTWVGGCCSPTEPTAGGGSSSRPEQPLSTAGPGARLPALRNESPGDPGILQSASTLGLGSGGPRKAARIPSLAVGARRRSPGKHPGKPDGSPANAPVSLTVPRQTPR